MLVRALDDRDRPWLGELIEREWGLPVVSISGCHDPATLDGFIADDSGERIGALTYRFDADTCEVVSINSLRAGQGVGSALLAAARELAEQAGSRLWLVTTNDNINAIRFYQKCGMDLSALHRDFVDEVRRWKPDVSDRGTAGIRFRHALEFSY